jgi:hypothetical protein
MRGIEVLDFRLLSVKQKILSTISLADLKL